MQKWQNVGELGPIMRCDKMFGYVSGSIFTMHYLEDSTSSSHNADGTTGVAPGLSESKNKAVIESLHSALHQALKHCE